MSEKYDGSIRGLQLAVPRLRIAMINPLSIRIALPNGLLFVRDSKIRKFPEFDDENASFWSIPTCVMIPGYPDCEGEADIMVGAMNQVSQGRCAAFDRTLETPSRKLILEIVPGEIVHEVVVPTDKTRVQVWTDGRHRCAKALVIGIS